MQQPGFGVDHDAVSQYTGNAASLSDELNDAGSALSAATELPGDAFGKLGAEVGFAAAFTEAAKAQADSVTAAVGGLSGLSKAVGASATGYQEREADHQALIDRADQR